MGPTRGAAVWRPGACPRNAVELKNSDVASNVGVCESRIWTRNAAACVPDVTGEAYVYGGCRVHALALGHEEAKDHDALRHQEAKCVSASVETQQIWTQPARTEKRAHRPGSPAPRGQGGLRSAWRTCDGGTMRAFAAGAMAPPPEAEAGKSLSQSVVGVRRRAESSNQTHHAVRCPECAGKPARMIGRRGAIAVEGSLPFPQP